MRATDDTVTPEAPVRAALETLPFLAEAGSALLDALVPHSDLRSYLQDDTIAAPGQLDGDQIVCIRSGELRLMRVASSFGDIDVHRLDEGGVLGLAELLAEDDGAGLRSASLVAVTDAELVFIDAAFLASKLVAEPAFARLVLRWAGAELLRQAQPQIDEIGPERRVYRSLYQRLMREGETAYIANLPRHAALAEEAGCSDREAAAAIGLLIERRIARRDYPRLVIEDLEQFRALAV
jgi:CRP-like cAMP-binding protein